MVDPDLQWFRNEAMQLVVVLKDQIFIALPLYVILVKNHVHESKDIVHYVLVLVFTAVHLFGLQLVDLVKDLHFKYD